MTVFAVNFKWIRDIPERFCTLSNTSPRLSQWCCCCCLLQCDTVLLGEWFSRVSKDHSTFKTQGRLPPSEHHIP